MKGVNKKTHLVNDSGEADTAVETVRGETILGEMGGDDDRRAEDVEVAEDDGGEEEEDVPKLYEVEAIRRKRVHKGKVQYLIKWRGWPETSNTWEPLKNLETISKWIDAFEERMRKADRKRKAKSGGSKSQLKNKNKKKKKTSHVEPNSRSVVGVARQAGLTEEEKEYDPTLNELRGTPGGGIGKGDNNVGTNGILKVKRKKKGLVGAKRRKSGIVKRYIPDENQTPDLTPGALDLNKLPHQSKMEEPDIMRIIKPVGVSTKQDSLVTFSALRSDGEEVKVDSKFLRVHNPNLLLDFYEQHITYKPESEEKCL